MDKQKSSNVWKYFRKDKKNNELAQCSLCPKILSCRGSNTSTMLKHLDKIHKLKVSSKREVEPKNITDTEEAQPSSSHDTTLTIQESTTDTVPVKRSRSECDQQNLDAFFRPTRKVSEIIARLAVQDGISIRAITRSEFIREAFKQKHLDLPKSEGKVMELILECSEEKKAEMMCELQILIKSGTRFSITVDEWTSLKNRRYLNINLHTVDGRVFNLGLAFIPGKFGAAEAQDMVAKHLCNFNLSFQTHIVATTSDGASVMKKFGRESPSEMLLCMNHAIHLAVSDVIYKKLDCRKIQNDNNSDTDDDDCMNDEYELSLDTTDHENDAEATIRLDLANVLSEVRKIVKLFRKSPLKNTLLQELIKKEMGQELQLLLDVKTRWNSLVTMIERFLKVKSCLKKALADMNYPWNEENEEVLQNLVQILKPIKLAVEALSRKDATLLTCDAIVSVLLNTIRRIQTPLSDELLSALEDRVLERRDIKLFSLCKYLNNPDTFTSTSSELPHASRASMISYAECLLVRLFANSYDKEKDNSSDDDITLQEMTSVSFETQLNEAINIATKSVLPATSSAKTTKLKKEFQIYEATKTRTHNLNLLFKALLSIKPTSTDSERAFSVAGSYVTKARNRLSDRSLNALVFLKSFFINKK